MRSSSGGEGPVRDQVVAGHRDLQDSIAQVVRTAVAEGQFRTDADPEQFAHDMYAVMLGFHHAHRLMSDPIAPARAWPAPVTGSSARSPRPGSTAPP